MAVGVDGAAGVLVGVDQRSEGDRGLEAVVEAEADLGEEGEVRAEPGQHDHLVDRVEALDGSLLVDSEPGAGTRIRAEIPCA